MRREPRDGAIRALHPVIIELVKVFLLFQMEDFDKSILHLTEAILLPPGPDPNIVHLLIRLALFLLAFFPKKFEQLNDVTYSTEYLRQLPTATPCILGNVVPNYLFGNWPLNSRRRGWDV